MPALSSFLGFIQLLLWQLSTIMLLGVPYRMLYGIIIELEVIFWSLSSYHCGTSRFQLAHLTISFWLERL